MTTKELIAAIDAQKALMIAVATGGPGIDSVNREYVQRRSRIQEALTERGLRDPNPYSELWRWYGKWSSGDLPSYASRRIHISELYQVLLETLTKPDSVGSALFKEPTGWTRVDRGIDSVRQRLETASSEEEYQTVGLLCRESLISLGQAVFDPVLHQPSDGVKVSNTDAKRMLEAYIAVELKGSATEETRRHALAALGLAVALQHRRTATFRDAAMCAEATVSVVNLIAIASGRRDDSA